MCLPPPPVINCRRHHHTTTATTTNKQQQYIDGLCSHPHSVCFTSSSLDDQPLKPDSIADPLRIRLPKSGIFKVR